MEKPFVSVVLPTYNRAGRLAEALDSVLLQDLPGLEVIVVDDGSTDGTRDLVSSYDGRMVYLFQENQGPAAARNRGIAAARGHWITFQDSDDLWLPGKLAAELAVFERFPEAEAVISDGRFWLEGALVTESYFAKTGLVPPGVADVFFYDGSPPLWTERSLFATCCFTIRRDALRRLGEPPFDPALRYYEDWDLEIRMYHECRVAVLPKVLAEVRRFDDGTRKAGAMPGGTISPEVWQESRKVRDRILERTLRISDLAPEEVRAIEETRAAIAQDLTG